MTPWTIVLGTVQARILEGVGGSSPGYLPNSGIEPRSPTLQVDSLPAELQMHIQIVLKYTNKNQLEDIIKKKVLFTIIFLKKIFKIHMGENSKALFFFFSKALLKDTKAALDKQQDVFYSYKEKV